MGEIRAVVFLGMNPWDYSEINDSVRFLAAACTKVDSLYIEPPRGLRGALNNPAYLLSNIRWRKTDRNGVTVYMPPLGFAPVFFGLRKYADNYTAAKFDRILEELYGRSWREQTLVYISSWSYTQTHFIKRLKPKYLIFHILDDSFAFPEIKNNPRVLAGNKSFYQYMMANSSAVIAVSPELAGKYSALYHRDVHIIKNGVNVEHFRRNEFTPVPEMAGIHQPVLMYTGSFNSWVDLKLLIKLADDRPGYSLVLIGHYYEGSTDANLWQVLLSKANVYWLQSKPYATLPAYMQHAAALLLPRTKDEHSLASDPLKLYEYLSTGKPVISTALPAVGDFREYVYVSDREDFAASIDRAIKEQDPARVRRQVAMMEKHSWRARVNELAGILLANCGTTFVTTQES
ncbi:MAG: putative teichuronic acid biosynthesis glycosyltransferase TuaH [Pelotomaculum sp. PtaB.Bin013]|uniref:Glycosyltransferase n=1 Tax=Pelotomaculum isophthalicicum JI TaxID=947010 RepID=A0A9X4JUU2_9FIRM|nr:glycosyltransferase [Pelotomaculum isophthalicicum]MDF9406956.1 glycosyltransferase [Pelotomaculum isophthalicicum JI]OPX90145.1 MAG: putative teichuronic acid biosynthesis glycosyltransferase TuaH [Pelotomaculum sp. PtaB.Bin013]